MNNDKVVKIKAGDAVQFNCGTDYYDSLFVGQGKADVCPLYFWDWGSNPTFERSGGKIVHS